MVGILSLLDVLWQMPMSELVNQIPIEPEVREALTNRQGWDGRVLSVIESREANDAAAVARGLRELPGITLKDLTQADFEAVVWADQLSAR